MEKWWQLNLILWKRYLIRCRIWLAFLAGVGIVIALSGRKPDKETEYIGIQVGVLAEDEKGRELLVRLQEDEGIFRFLPYEEKEEMQRQIENGELECGFVLPEHFYENMEKGKLMRQIRLYYSPASSAHKISYEVIFSHLLELLSDHILEDYMNYSEESGVFSKDEKKENLAELLELKNNYERNGSTFSFIYEQVGKEEAKEAGTLNPIRGGIAVLIYLMSLLGLAGCCDLDKSLKGLTVRNRIKIKETSLNISILGSVLSGGILLLISGAGEGIKRELPGFVIYFAVLQIYIRILKLVVRKAEALYGLIPVLVLGSLLFCPVFIQIKAYLSMAGYIEKLFPVSYYLNWR